MRSDYPPVFERDMACTEAEWLRLLPLAIGGHEWRRDARGGTVQIGTGTLHLGWEAGEPRVIALVRLPRLHVIFRFADVAPDQRLSFMRRFDLHMQRGGG